mmetsp:Transcript_47681/g.75896  ORF Transcript_47681/g.75896 Transcript_47681/m.75896 type:complete len:260 (-) Transcript_47681:1487-2266(-)
MKPGIHQRCEKVLFHLFEDMEPLICLLIFKEEWQAGRQHLQVFLLDPGQLHGLQLHGQGLGDVQVEPHIWQTGLLVHVGGVAMDITPSLPLSTLVQKSSAEGRSLSQQDCHIVGQQGRVLRQHMDQAAEANLQDVFGVGDYEESPHDVQHIFNHGVYRHLSLLRFASTTGTTIFVPSALRTLRGSLGTEVLQQQRGESQQLRLHLPPLVVGQGREGGQQGQDRVVRGELRHTAEDREARDARPWLGALHGDQSIVDVQI